MARPRTGRQSSAEYQRRYRERKKAQGAMAQTNWMLDVRLTDAIRHEAKARGLRESELAMEILSEWYEARFGGRLPPAQAVPPQDTAAPPPPPTPINATVELLLGKLEELGFVIPLQGIATQLLHGDDRNGLWAAVTLNGLDAIEFGLIERIDGLAQNILHCVVDTVTRHAWLTSDVYEELNQDRDIGTKINTKGTRNNMPALLAEVETIMAGGLLNAVETFNQVQVRNEQAKQALVAAHPTLHDSVCQLEDHELLRGGLTVFDLSPAQDPRTIASRARQFLTLFKHPYHQVSAALLVKGHTGRSRQRSSGHRLAYLGAPRQAGLWENHWRIRYNEAIHPSSAALQSLLDDLASGQTPQAVIDTFVQAPSTPKDWRYYIAKYEVMRGASLDFAGNFILGPGSGYAICMPLSDSCDNRSNHHDAYLLALANKAGLTPSGIGNHGWPRCFPGHETNERHLILRRSKLKIRCVENGWALSDLPSEPALRSAFDTVASRYAIQGGLFAVPQTQGIDIEDRIILGAQLLHELIEAGL